VNTQTNVRITESVKIDASTGELLAPQGIDTSNGRLLAPQGINASTGGFLAPQGPGGLIIHQ
jgi:hypothetical protein